MSQDLEKRIYRLLGDLEKFTAQEEFALNHQDIETLQNLVQTKQLILNAFLETLNKAQLNFNQHPSLEKRLVALQLKWKNNQEHLENAMSGTQEELAECRRAYQKIKGINDSYDLSASSPSIGKQGLKA